MNKGLSNFAPLLNTIEFCSSNMNVRHRSSQNWINISNIKHTRIVLELEQSKIFLKNSTTIQYVVNSFYSRKNSNIEQVLFLLNYSSFTCMIDYCSSLLVNLELVF